MAKTDLPKLERTYTIPLRKEYLKVPYYLRSKKSISALKKFLTKHMKSEEIRLGKALNEKVWERSSSNPPCKVKVMATRDEKGVVRVELFGVKTEVKAEKVKKEKAPVKKEAPK